MSKDSSHRPGKGSDKGSGNEREGSLRKPAKPDARQARLEQALRANLLKRKEKNREKDAISRAAQEGGTGPKGKG